MSSMSVVTNSAILLKELEQKVPKCIFKGTKEFLEDVVIEVLEEEYGHYANDEGITHDRQSTEGEFQKIVVQVEEADFTDLDCPKTCYVQLVGKLEEQSGKYLFNVIKGMEIFPTKHKKEFEGTIFCKLKNGEDTHSRNWHEEDNEFEVED